MNLIKELILNIEIDKNIFDYIFQKISSLYREEQPISPNILKDYLSILSCVISDIEYRSKPHNYFCCNADGDFIANLNQLELNINYWIFIINIKLGTINTYNNKRISDLI